MSSQDEADQTLKTAIQNAQSFCLIPLISLILDNTGIDISEKVGIDASKKEYGKINIKPPSGKNISVGVVLVDHDYNIMESFNDSGLCDVNISSFEELSNISEEFKEKTVELASYLMHCCLFVFNNLKNDIVELSEYQLTMDNNTKLFLLNSGKDLETIKYLSVFFKSE